MQVEELTLQKLHFDKKLLDLIKDEIGKPNLEFCFIFNTLMFQGLFNYVDSVSEGKTQQGSKEANGDLTVKQKGEKLIELKGLKVHK